MFKYLKSLVTNKKGNIGMIYVILMFVLICVNMVFGIMETSLSISTVNEVKDILENIAPSAARKGIDENAHKNEMIETRYKSDVAKQYFIREVADSIDNMAFRGRIKTSKQQIKQYLDQYTTVKPGKGKWVNTWGEGYSSGVVQDNRKEIDYVIVSTVLPLELKNGNGTVDVQRIEDQFNISDKNGVSSPLKVEITVGKNSLGVFIKFEMKIVLK